MLNLVKYSLLVVFCFFSFFASATPIFEKDKDFIQYEYNKVVYDLTWASPFNIQFYGQMTQCDSLTSLTNTELDASIYNALPAPSGCNQLFGAKYGWSFYSDLISGISLNNFLKGVYEQRQGIFGTNSKIMDIFSDNTNGQIDSFSVWNSEIITSYNSSIALYNVGSDWRSNTLRVAGPFDVFTNQDIFNSTIYVRKSQKQPVPEPATILIFAIALLALSVRSRKQA